MEEIGKGHEPRLTVRVLRWIAESGVGAIGVGLFFAFALNTTEWRVIGLILAALGTATIADDLFGIIALQPRSAGQMIIGTFVNIVLAGGLAAAILSVGMDVNSAYPDRAQLDSTVLAFSAIAFTLQGVVLSLVGWWKWFGRKRPPHLVDELRQILAEDYETDQMRWEVLRDVLKHLSELESRLGQNEAGRDEHSMRMGNALAEQQRQINALNERFDELELRREQDEVRHLNELRKIQRGEGIP